MPFRKIQWLFPIAVTLHNSEEAIFMPRWIAAHVKQLPFNPDAATIWSGLLSLTLAAFAITYLSARSGKGSIWAYLLFGYAAAMLANVFIPHLAATFVLRAYTPGVISAVLINFPLMSLLLFKATGEEWVSGKKAVAYALLVPLVIAAFIASLFAVTTT